MSVYFHNQYDIKLKKSSLLSHHMVDIYVGPENTHWILHEKLLCARSRFFSNVFYTKHSKTQGNKVLGLPDEEDSAFRLFVGWLYSEHVPPPKEEKDLADLFDVYLMGEKWQISALVKEVLDSIRTFYRTTDTFPGLRRVQYVYANTGTDSPMRQLLVESVARMLVLGSTFPAHWERALGKNGEMAVDIIKAVSSWKLDPASVPDARVEPLKGEKEKVKEVENAEATSGELSKGELKEKGVAADGKDVDHLTNGVNGVTVNGH